MAFLEPAARYSCVTATVDSRTYVWGGYTGPEDLQNLYFIDIVSGKWQFRPITGQHPPGFYSCSFALVNNFLYIYGGKAVLNEDTGALFCLDLYGFSWREVSPNIHRRNGPKKKTGCGMFIHEDKVYLFGGDCNGQFTNELHVFNLSKGSWSRLVTIGSTPPPCWKLSFVKVGNSTAIMFGGHFRGYYSDRLYKLDLNTRHWTQIPHMDGEPWPEKRYCHASGCVAVDNHIQLMITGGIEESNDAHNDLWLLDIMSMTWRKVPVIQEKRIGRYDHIAAVVKVTENVNKIVIFGGAMKRFTEYIAETTLLRLEKKVHPDSSILEWNITDVAGVSELGAIEYKKDLYVKQDDKVPDDSPELQQEKTTVQEGKSSSAYVYPPLPKLTNNAKEDDKVSDDSPELQQEETTVQEGKSSSAIVYPPLPKLKNNGTPDQATIESPGVQQGKSSSVYKYPPLPQLTKNVNKKTPAGFSVTNDISVTYGGKKGSLDWKECGLTLLFGDSSLPLEASECPVHISAGESGAFRYPSTVEAASSVYHIDSQKQLHASVTIQIQHSVDEEQIQNMCFVTCSEVQPPYDYRILRGGLFTSTYGEIVVTKFSFYSIGRILTKFGVRGVLSLMEKSYEASLYRSVQPTLLTSGYSWNVYVSAVKNCSIFKKSVEKFIKSEYDDKVKLEARRVVRFNTTQSNVNILTSCRANIKGAVSLETTGCCSLRKTDISCYVDACPPHIKFILEAKPGCSMKITFTLDGCQEPNNFFILHHSIPIESSTMTWHSTSTSSISTVKDASMQQMYSFTMDKLTLHKWTNNEQRVCKLFLINEMSPDWKRASDLLGLTPTQTRRIEMNKHTVEDRCREVMAEWLSNKDEVYNNYPRSWAGLCELLCDMELSTLAQKVKTSIK